MTEPQERILSILNGAGEAPRDLPTVAAQAGFTVRETQAMLSGLVDTGLADQGEGGYFLTAAGEEDRPYSGVWLDGKLCEIHTPDGMTTYTSHFMDYHEGG